MTILGEVCGYLAAVVWSRKRRGKGCGAGWRNTRGGAGEHRVIAECRLSPRFTVSSFASSSRVKAMFRWASVIPMSDSVRSVMTGDCFSTVRQSAEAGRSNSPSRRSTPIARRPSLFSSSSLPSTLKPLHIRVHHVKRMAILLFGGRLLPVSRGRAANVATVGIVKETVPSRFTVRAWPFTSSTSFSNSAREPLSFRTPSALSSFTFVQSRLSSISGAVLCKFLRSGTEYLVVTYARVRNLSRRLDQRSPWSLRSPLMEDVGGRLASAPGRRGSAGTAADRQAPPTACPCPPPFGHCRPSPCRQKCERHCEKQIGRG